MSMTVAHQPDDVAAIRQISSGLLPPRITPSRHSLNSISNIQSQFANVTNVTSTSSVRSTKPDPIESHTAQHRLASHFTASMSADSSQQVTFAHLLFKGGSVYPQELLVERLSPFLPATGSWFVHLTAATQRGLSDIFSSSALPGCFIGLHTCACSPIYKLIWAGHIKLRQTFDEALGYWAD